MARFIMFRDEHPLVVQNTILIQNKMSLGEENELVVDWIRSGGWCCRSHLLFRT